MLATNMTKNMDEYEIGRMQNIKISFERDFINVVRQINPHLQFRIDYTIDLEIFNHQIF